MPVITEQFTNTAVSTLAGGAGGVGTALNPADVTLLVQTGHGNARFPAASSSVGTFQLVLGDPTTPGAFEICKGTNRAGDVCTLLRAQEGTSAGTWPVGTTVQATVTAGSLQTLYARLTSAPLNVHDYGALGNGVQDDTSFIQNALSAANSAGGGQVYLPAGTYLVAGLLTLYPNVDVVGDGIDDTIIKLKNGANADVFQGQNFLTLTGTNNASAGVGNWLMRDLTIDGNKANQSVAIANPTVAATTSGASNAGGNLKASTLYTFGYTWKNAAGESALVTATTGYTPPAGTNTNQITLTAPTLPGGATGTNWYLVSSADVAAVIGYVGTSATNALAITTAPSSWNVQTQPPALNSTTQSSGIRVYGYGYTLHNVNIRNCWLDGFYSEWATASNVNPVADSLEAHLTFVKSHDNFGHGIVWGGPHDSVWDSVITFQNGTSDDGHAGMYIRYNSNMQGGRLQILNSHSWGNSQSWAIKSEATLSTTNTQWEGAQRAQVLLTGSDASHAATDTVIQNDVLYAAGVIANPVGLELGATSPAAVTITGLQGWLKIINCTTAAIKATNDGGLNDIHLQDFQASGSLTSGAVAATTRLDIHAIGAVGPSRLTVKDHLLGIGTAPTLGALQAGVSSQSIVGNDVRGTITITTAGASPPGAGATLAILTYNSPFAGVPIVFVQQAGIINFFWTASGTGGFSVATAAVLTISTTYFINYIVVG